MKILAHRGYWRENRQNNSPQALRAALEHGYGFESDLRDYQGELVISHDIADATCQQAGEVFQWLREFSDRYPFAINVKADGMKDLLLAQLREKEIKNYFTFDMSVPQMIEYDEAGIRFFTRQSEVEPAPVLYERASGVWIDGFWQTDWITTALLEGHIEKGKTVCLVSPELHGRAYEEFWKQLLRSPIDFSKVFLCTNYPDEAAKMFRNKLGE